MLSHSKTNFVQVYDTWDVHARSAYHYTKDIDVSSGVDLSKYDSIIFAGMGGSATAGEIAASLLNRSAPRCAVLKGSVLPEGIDDNTLVIVSSISGNTYEMINVLKSCLSRRIDAISISSGGELEKLSLMHGVFHIRVQNLGAPRISLPCVVYPVLNVLKNIEKGIEQEIQLSLESLSELSPLINSSVPTERNIAKQLASFMQDITPICYHSPLMGPAGIRFKNSLNENAKKHVICDDIEEVCHNGIVPFSYEEPDRYGVVFLRSKGEEGMLSKKFDALQTFLRGRRIRFFEAFSFGESMLAKLMCSIYLLDFSSIYLALLKGYDPSLTPAIDYIKSALRDE